MIKRQVYSSWAYTENEQEKAKINRQIYDEELAPKSKMFWGANVPTEEDKKQFTCCKHKGTGYANKTYEILSNPHKLSTDQLALICDKGNLCFGYRANGNKIVVHTD